MVTYYLIIVILVIFCNKYLKFIVKTVPLKTDSKGVQQTSEWNIIALKNANAYNIPVKIILGIIYVESRGSETSIGSFNEIGLMQLTKNALTDINMENANMSDPVQNIKAGAKYLRFLYNQTFDLNLAIQSYNQGYSRVLSNPNAGLKYLNKVITASEYFA